MILFKDNVEHVPKFKYLGFQCSEMSDLDFTAKKFYRYDLHAFGTCRAEPERKMSV
jgi:hypothetical protein